MLKTMLKPFLKKYFGLFISMVFVSALSIALLCTFGSTIANLRSSYRSYLNDYGDIDEQISTEFTTRENILSFMNQISEVEKADARITLDAFMQRDDGRTIVSRIFSFNEHENTVFNRYILQKVEENNDYINISICNSFARNNNIKLGQVVKIGYFNLFLEFYVNEIVETAEGIYPRANDYIWSDNQDFGYMYIDENELNRALLDFAEYVKQELVSNPDFKEEYESTIGSSIMAIPDLREIDENFVAMFANQVIVRNKEGNGSQEVIDKIANIISEKGVTVKTKTIGDNLPYRAYMANAIKQLTVAAIFLPVFFYSVTMVVIILFMNQIIKSMTSEIGIMMSIGIDRKEIISLFLIFGLLMSIFAGIIGSAVGYGLNSLMTDILIRVYSLPVIPRNLYWAAVLVAIVLLVGFSLLATYLSCRSIFKITPKDAVISNESKRKSTPIWISQKIDKAPVNIKLGLNSIFQNPRRFFVSFFAIFASLIIIILALLFHVAKNEMIDQSVQRRLSFDCQVYLMEKASDESIDNIKKQEFVTSMEDCYYTYIEASVGDKKIYIESIGMNNNDLINVPSSDGYGKINVEAEGIIIPEISADTLGVKKGDKISINGKEVVITDISRQYFHPLAYMSKDQMSKLELKMMVSTFFLNINNEEAFLKYMSENNNKCLTVFTRSLSKDLHNIFNSIDVFIYIMIGFSLGMSFIILIIMSQNALMEQKRQLSVMRAIGFTIMDISNFWSLQSILQLVVGVLLAVPTGIGFAVLLFKLCSSDSQIYPFVFDWGMMLLGIGFVLAVVFLCHIISMVTIKRWNLADNTRCRE